MTNADKIRAMTDEEMTKFFVDLPDACPPNKRCFGNCSDCWLDWLKQEVEE